MQEAAAVGWHYIPLIRAAMYWQRAMEQLQYGLGRRSKFRTDCASSHGSSLPTVLYRTWCTTSSTCNGVAASDMAFGQTVGKRKPPDPMIGSSLIGHDSRSAGGRALGVTQQLHLLGTRCWLALDAGPAAKEG